MEEKSVINRSVEVTGGVHAPGHLSGLTQIVDFELVDAVLAETGTREKRLRLLPSRVVVYFVLALAVFERCSYRATWGKLTAALTDLRLTQPNISSCRVPLPGRGGAAAPVVRDPGRCSGPARAARRVLPGPAHRGHRRHPAAQFLHGVAATGAQFLLRSSARRRPTTAQRLPDGSYLARIGYGTLPALLLVRVIEAQVTVTLADGTTRAGQWRRVTSLLDHCRYPARGLVNLNHERW